MRKVIHWFVCAPAFDKFIMIVIVFSSLAIAAEDPVDEDNPRNYYLSKADYVFTITFACEVCLKVIFKSLSKSIFIHFKSQCFTDSRPWFYSSPRVLHERLLECDGYHRGQLLHGLILPHNSVSSLFYSRLNSQVFEKQ